MPSVAPVHVACHGGQLAAGVIPATRHQSASAQGIAAAGTPWTTGYGRFPRLIGLVNGHPARRLGSPST